MNQAQILEQVEMLIAKWQVELGDSCKIVLGGSLVSGLAIIDSESTSIDVDLRFLSDDISNEMVTRIEKVTGLQYRKTKMVDDWPSGQSQAMMIEGLMNIPSVELPLDMEGCLRSPAYVGWARFYKKVFTPEELNFFLEQKIALRHDKVEYKAMKKTMVQEAIKRCLDQGLVSM